MKVSTDSIVLGSWVLSLFNTADLPGPTRTPPTALDIGSGSGLLSIMLAQGFAGSIEVDAVEIDASASQQAKENVANSPWSKTVTSHCKSINAFNQGCNSTQLYDLIITNPPYFRGSTESTEAYVKQTEQRKVARNQQSLPLTELLDIIAQRLKPLGNAFMCFPANEQEDVMQLAHSNGLSVSHCLSIKSQSEKKPYLICVAMSKSSVKTHYSELIIYQPGNVYSSDFRKLCAKFYRDF